MLSVIGFLLGIHLMMVLLAAGYRYLDLWYCIRDSWLDCTRRMALAVLVEVFLLWLLEGELFDGFVWGQVFYLAIHLSKYFIARLLLRFLAARR